MTNTNKKPTTSKMASSPELGSSESLSPTQSFKFRGKIGGAKSASAFDDLKKKDDDDDNFEIVNTMAMLKMSSMGESFDMKKYNKLKEKYDKGELNFDTSKTLAGQKKKFKIFMYGHVFGVIFGMLIMYCLSMCFFHGMDVRTVCPLLCGSFDNVLGPMGATEEEMNGESESLYEEVNDMRNSGQYASSSTKTHREEPEEEKRRGCTTSVGIDALGDTF